MTSPANQTEYPDAELPEGFAENFPGLNVTTASDLTTQQSMAVPQEGWADEKELQSTGHLDPAHDPVTDNPEVMAGLRTNRQPDTAPPAYSPEWNSSTYGLQPGSGVKIQSNRLRRRCRITTDSSNTVPVYVSHSGSPVPGPGGNCIALGPNSLPFDFFTTGSIFLYNPPGAAAVATVYAVQEFRP